MSPLRMFLIKHFPNVADMTLGPKLLKGELLSGTPEALERANKWMESVHPYNLPAQLRIKKAVHRYYPE